MTFWHWCQAGQIVLADRVVLPPGTTGLGEFPEIGGIFLKIDRTTFFADEQSGPVVDGAAKQLPGDRDQLVQLGR